MITNRNREFRERVYRAIAPASAFLGAPRSPPTNSPKEILLSKIMATKPYIKRTKPSKKSYRRRRKSRRKATFIPKTIVRKLKTSFSLSLDPSTGNIATYLFNLNSAHDPLGNASATQQGLGADQYDALYKRYTIVGWKVKVEAVSTDNSAPIVIGFTPTAQDTALTNYNHYKELPATVSRIMTPDIDKVYFSTKGSVKKWLLPYGGRILIDDTLSAEMGSSPSKILFGHLWAQGANTGADPGAVYVIGTLEQVIVYYDTKIPARSTQ